MVNNDLGSRRRWNQRGLKRTVVRRPPVATTRFSICRACGISPTILAACSGPSISQRLLQFATGSTVSRLLAALAAEEPAASVDAVLSLQTASSMAGATEIAEHCARILPLVVARDFPRARVQVAALERSVDVLVAASPMLLAHAEARLGAMGAVAAISP